MIEVRIHGRGGQGGKKAAQVLARAAYLSGFVTQDFAMYGAERKGAPVTSFVRIDKKKINTRGYIFEPDYIFILDDSLGLKHCLKGMRKGTKIIINSSKKHGKNFYNIDVTRIALEEIGKAFVNVALLGGFLKIFKKIPMKNLYKAVSIELGHHMELYEKNIKAAKRCYDELG